MPYFRIETNKELDAPKTKELLKKTSDFVAQLLGKPEKYVMVSINPGTQMIFGGNNEPVAYIELKSIGLPKEKCSDFSNGICEFVEAEIGISADRVYIDFGDIERKMFGWNGSTF